MKKTKTIYYESESDELLPRGKREPPRIDGSYRYIGSGLLHRVAAFVFYRVIMTPIAFIYTRLKFSERYVGKEKLKAYRGRGFFIYSNHTQMLGDAFSPNVVAFPKRVYVVVSSANLALPVIGGKTALLGALPLPDDVRAARHFTEAVKRRLSEGAAIAVYPEAHVWEYYTGLRPFGGEAFELPVMAGAPVFAVTRVYRKRRHGARPKCVLYVDGPFIPNAALSRRAARDELCEQVKAAMLARTKLSDAELIKYEKRKGEESDE